MTRQHKFRFWDTKYNVMIPWDCLCQTAFNCCQLKGNKWQKYGLMYDCFTNDMRYICLPFTGKLDINGKEIYEGDVVKVNHRETIGIVVWEAEDTRYYIKINACCQCIDKLQNTEIIGNIYENKLLEDIVYGRCMKLRPKAQPTSAGLGGYINYEQNSVSVYFPSGVIKDYSPSELDVYIESKQEWKSLSNALYNEDLHNRDTETPMIVHFYDAAWDDLFSHIK